MATPEHCFQTVRGWDGKMYQLFLREPLVRKIDWLLMCCQSDRDMLKLF
jgi:hypothetical protein